MGIIDASATGRGALHLKGLEIRKSRYGALEFQEDEVNTLREFGKVVGAFLQAVHGPSLKGLKTGAHTATQKVNQR